MSQLFVGGMSKSGSVEKDFMVETRSANNDNGKSLLELHE